jgi:hypothetical protein
MQNQNLRLSIHKILFINSSLMSTFITIKPSDVSIDLKVLIKSFLNRSWVFDIQSQVKEWLYTIKGMLIFTCNSTF